MGTSQSNPGPGGGTPLVPPWADDQPQTPLPLPEPARYSPFRRALGDFIRSGDNNDLRAALGHYARRGTGGSSIAARRMGGVMRSGAALYGTLAGARETGAVSESTVDLSTLAGLPCNAAIDAIAQALSPDDGDSDKIRSAMNFALVEALDGVEIFDPGHITDEIIANTMVNFLAESIFFQIVADAGRAWTKAETATQAITAENALRELIHVIVDKYMVPKLTGNIRSFTRQEMNGIQREVIQSVWKEWEAYR
jgi:hypothetical protein